MQQRYALNPIPEDGPADEQYLNNQAAAGWRIAHVIQAWTDAAGVTHSPVLVMERAFDQSAPK